MNHYIIVKTEFAAIHSWPECPIEEVSFLRNPHRHVFHIVLKKEVTHNDRDIEIIQLKNCIHEFLEQYRNKDMGRKSCEDLAEELITKFNAVYVSVLEDNENGAEIHR